RQGDQRRRRGSGAEGAAFVRFGSFRVVLFVSAAVISACTSVATTTAGPTAGTSPTTSVATQSAQPMTLQILGAASLKGALDKMKIAYEGSHPGTTISFSTDSSAALEA